MGDSGNKPFWRVKSLEEMTPAEWESLCDGCGRCCLNKLEDWDTGEIAWTNVACTLLDGESCRCSDYANRRAVVPDCIGLTAAEVRKIVWLPPTCAYRLVRDGEDLYWWHPLVSGDPETVHAAGVSVRGRTISEDGMDTDDLEDHLAEWPGEDPMAGEVLIDAGIAESKKHEIGK
ncbi:MAG: YcgN family cysteine cluster protein [Rhizobiaceae bacterium]|nr:YcgN family cysteine cluster protein [Rhizobiaceae bacterium]